MNKRVLFLIITLLLMALWQTAAVEAASDKRVKADGILTSIESDGTVIISDKGFNVDPTVRIYSARGERTTLDSLSLPTKIHFEFIYLTSGPDIVLIREMGQ